MRISTLNSIKEVLLLLLLTGSAAVGINVETTHHACQISPNNNQQDLKDIEEWENTIMYIIDEISFAKLNTIEDINKSLNAIKDKGPG